MIGMLKGMDTNKNDVLEPNEIPNYRRGFVNSIVTRMGGNPNGPINLTEFSNRVANLTPQSNQQNNQSGTTLATALPSDPLVPYFGEKETASAPVLTFGQREPKPAAVAASKSTAGINSSDQLMRSARDIMTKFDKNKNGTLDKDKGEWTGSLPFKAEDADKNHDGRVTMTELIAILGGKSTGSAGAAVIATRQSDFYDRLPQGMPDWFFARDKDKDGQLTMMEYANEQTWSKDLADEFIFLDRNNDGIATATEIIASLKQFDEEKALAAEKEKREKLRRGAALPPKPLPDGNQQSNQSSGPPYNQPGQPPTPSNNEKPQTEQAAAPSNLPTTGPYAAGNTSGSTTNRDSSRYRGNYPRSVRPQR
jgi:Ca2+-binding EF-hand superfamily protein